MRWKRVAWAGCLLPVLGGCHPSFHGARDLVAEKLVPHTEAGIEHRIRSDARRAWRAVRAEFPRRVFTAEFRDGFLDGYADYLDRGGDAQPPAVPPARYTQNQKYYTPEGHLLLRDYFLGFQYGTDVAVATGQRQFLTVPVLVPDAGVPVPVDPVPVDPLPATIPPVVLPPMPTPLPLPLPKPLPGSDSPAVPRVPVSRAPAVPAPESGIPGFHLPAWGNPAGTRAGTPARPTATAPHEPDALPPDVPAVPAPEDAPSKFRPIPRPADTATPDFTVPTIPVPAVVRPSAFSEPAPAPRPEVDARLPEPPPEVGTLPAHVPTPPVLDELPVLPPNHTVPPPLPANHSDPVRK